MARTSIKDVAERAGVAISTVSNTINHPDKVLPELQTRIRTAMRDLNYIPNEAARKLRYSKTTLLGFIGLDLGNPFFTEISRGAEETGAAAGYSFILGNGSSDLAKQSEYIDLFERQRLDGIVIAGLQNAGDVVRATQLRGTPIVSIGHTFTRFDHCSVTVDDTIGGAIAAGALADAGSTSIVYAVDEPAWYHHGRRIAGANEELTRRGMAPVRTVAYGGGSFLGADYTRIGHELARAVVAIPGVDAVIAPNDVIAIGIERALLDLGVRVPEDVSIVSYDDGPAAEWAPIRLSSVSQSAYRLGSEAMSLLIDEIEDPSHIHLHVLVEPVLTPRDSVRRT